jgi:DNA polymerase-3 subunit delta'
MSESFVDLKFFGRQKDKATIGVDDMRLLKEDAMLSGTESEAKVYVIDDAHALTVESQNALLNILEEPPRGVTVILLATECDKILTTIKSRVQYIAMTRFTDDEIEAFSLENIPEAKDMRSFAPKKFSGIIKNSEGIIGRAIKLFKKGEAEKNDEERQEILDIIDSLMPKAPFEKLHSAMANLPQKRAELMPYLEKIIMAVRDLVVIKEASDPKLTFFISMEEAEQRAKSISIKRLLAIYDALILSHEYCAKNANVGTVIANLEGKIKLA